jgi:hypothetical protein
MKTITKIRSVWLTESGERFCVRLAWCPMPVIIALGKLRQEDHGFEARLGYRVSSIQRENLSQKKKKD